MEGYPSPHFTPCSTDPQHQFGASFNVVDTIIITIDYTCSASQAPRCELIHIQAELLLGSIGSVA